ncbi:MULTISPECIES: hypothetical protein [unclassified Streptomyces]|uniref:hypothetical protein n=1 Tax=unclassified Streptomyces TaxID=2593676 RepID=UPI00039D6748|nr:hypothetical protein [Streptomyces sp. LaPpAH-202]MYW61329.1 hypothetical protein [Streptomyces sp. SID8370]MYW87276.1 hypothetical protein [Streptomyces sp. SID8371]
MNASNDSRDVLGWLAMLACVVIAAHGEWSLAVAAGYHPYVAAAFPVAVDAYAIRSMKAGREVLPPVLLMVATNAAAHLVHAGMLPVTPWLVVAVSAVAPVVLWRVHALRRPTAEPNRLGAAKMAQRGKAAAGRVTQGSLITDEGVPTLVVDGDGPSFSVDRVPERQPEPAPEPTEPGPPLSRGTASHDVPVLGPFTPVAELLAGTAGTTGGTCPEQHERVADPAPEPDPEPAKPEPEPVPRPARGVSAEHVVTVKTWLAVEPDLSGTEIGTRLGKSDSYGRRVRRAALAGAAR